MTKLWDTPNSPKDSFGKCSSVFFKLLLAWQLQSEPPQNKNHGMSVLGVANFRARKTAPIFRFCRVGLWFEKVKFNWAKKPGPNPRNYHDSINVYEHIPSWKRVHIPFLRRHFLFKDDCPFPRLVANLGQPDSERNMQLPVLSGFWSLFCASQQGGFTSRTNLLR